MTNGKDGSKSAGMKRVKQSGDGRGKKAGAFLLLLLTAFSVTGCSMAERVRYEMAGGSIAIWEEMAASEELPVSMEEYYYDHLPENLQEAYRELYVKIMRGEDSGNLLSTVTVEEFWDVYYSVLADHPEIFWHGTRAQVEESGLTGTVVAYEFDVTVPKEARTSMKDALEAEADACIAQIPEQVSAYEKIKAVYEFVIRTAEYKVGSQDSQNIQSVLLYHTSVCAGYAKTFQYILNRMGIFCTYVTGTIRDGGDHGWNMVRIDDNYYYVDVTWGDPVFAGQMERTDLGSVMNYNYLCCTQDELFRTHVPGDLVELPVCDKDDYDYYKKNGLYFDTFSYDALYQALMNSVWNGEDHIAMKFGSREAYERAVYELFENGMLQDPGQYLMKINGVTSWNYRYHTDEEFRVVTIYW